jgi:hypothetical protein
MINHTPETVKLIRCREQPPLRRMCAIAEVMVAATTSTHIAA